MANKMTKKDWFVEILAIVESAEVEDEKKEGIKTFINHEMKLLKKKSSAGTQTKTQKENLETMEKIISALTEVGKPVTISELQTEKPEMAEYSNQKLSALLKKLVDSGRVTKTQEKKKSYFSIGQGQGRKPHSPLIRKRVDK